MPRDQYKKKQTPIRKNTKVELPVTGGFKMEDHYYCCICGESFPTLTQNFPVSKSAIWGGRDHYLPMCKGCLTKLFDHYLDAYGGDIRNAIRRVCMITDLYYSDSTVKAIGEGKWKSTSPIHSYISRLNLTQGIGKTYDSTIDEEKANGAPFSVFDLEGTLESKSQRRKIADDDTLIDRWGGGLKKTDYTALEDHYAILKKNNPNIDSNQEIFVKDLCRINLMKSNAMKEGSLDAFVKASEQYSKIFTKAGLKTVEDKDSSSNDTFGVTLQTIAKYTPEEFYKDKPLYEDYDQLGEYIERHMTRPLSNLIKGTDIRDEEYHVPDDGEVDGDD